jgi:hypothetical protein
MLTAITVFVLLCLVLFFWSNGLLSLRSTSYVSNTVLININPLRPIRSDTPGNDFCVMCLLFFVTENKLKY